MKSPVPSVWKITAKEINDLMARPAAGAGDAEMTFDLYWKIKVYWFVFMLVVGGCYLIWLGVRRHRRRTIYRRALKLVGMELAVYLQKTFGRSWPEEWDELVFDFGRKPRERKSA